jgi:polyphosphate kinase 2 (PPK2 family)
MVWQRSQRQGWTPRERIDGGIMSQKWKNDREQKSRADSEPELQSDSKQKLKNKVYLKELRKLQEKLCKLQDWVRFKGLRTIIIFEGRDAAGKGGTIKALT